MIAAPLAVQLPLAVCLALLVREHPIKVRVHGRDIIRQLGQGNPHALHGL